MIFRDALRRVILGVLRDQKCENGEHCPKYEWPAHVDTAPETLLNHRARHEPLGADLVRDINIGGTGVLLSLHRTRHQPGGVDQVQDIDILGTGVNLSTHRTRHEFGGADALTALDTSVLTSGILGIARGGIGLGTIAAGGILYATALDTLARLAPTAANQVLRSTAANALQFATLVAGDLPAHATLHEPAGADEVNDIDIGNTGVLLSAHQARHRPAGADPLPVGTPSNIGTANAEGSSEEFARLDHVHNHPVGLGFSLHHDHDGPRYIKTLWAENKEARNVGTAGRVFLVPFPIIYTVTLDRLIVVYHTPVAGNIRLGIYEDNGDTPQGGSLAVETASTAKAGTLRAQEIAIADTQLTPALYWFAIQSDETTTDIFRDTLATYFYHTNDPAGVGGMTLSACRYDRAGGYGAFTDPCPTITWSHHDSFIGYARVKSVP